MYACIHTSTIHLLLAPHFTQAYLSCPSQVVLLSATMPEDVLDVTTKFMRDPIRILVKKEELTLDGIQQFFVLVEKEVGQSVRCIPVPVLK